MGEIVTEVFHWSAALLLIQSGRMYVDDFAFDMLGIVAEPRYIRSGYCDVDGIAIEVEQMTWVARVCDWEWPDNRFGIDPLFEIFEALTCTLSNLLDWYTSAWQLSEARVKNCIKTVDLILAEVDWSHSLSSGVRSDSYGERDISFRLIVMSSLTTLRDYEVFTGCDQHAWAAHFGHSPLPGYKVISAKAIECKTKSKIDLKVMSPQCKPTAAGELAKIHIDTGNLPKWAETVLMTILTSLFELIVVQEQSPPAAQRGGGLPQPASYRTDVDDCEAKSLMLSARAVEKHVSLNFVGNVVIFTKVPVDSGLTNGSGQNALPVLLEFGGADSVAFIAVSIPSGMTFSAGKVALQPASVKVITFVAECTKLIGL